MIDELLSDEGWPYASSPPVEEGDPGRFHALFGRDSLITALQVLPERPEVARATLRALAARQGRATHPGTLEEPGKIGHEFRDAAPRGVRRRAAGRTRARSPTTARPTRRRGSSSLATARRAAGSSDAWRAAGGVADRRARPRRRARPPGARASGGALTQQGWRDTIDPTRLLRRRHPAARRQRARAAARRRRLAGRRVRRAARARRATTRGRARCAPGCRRSCRT